MRGLDISRHRWAAEASFTIRRAAYDAKEKIKEKLAELHYKKRSDSDLHDKLKGAINRVRSGLLSRLARR